MPSLRLNDCVSRAILPGKCARQLGESSPTASRQRKEHLANPVISEVKKVASPGFEPLTVRWHPQGELTANLPDTSFPNKFQGDPRRALVMPVGTHNRSVTSLRRGQGRSGQCRGARWLLFVITNEARRQILC
jgi:hypothetical protein